MVTECGETERPKTQHQEQAEETSTTMTDMIAHARSAGVRNPYLEMFKVPPTDLSMSSRRFVRINPFNVGINPVTFQVDPQEDFIDLKESYFEVELTVKKDNNTNLLAADVIGLANNLVHTLFKQINVRLNGTLISPQTDTYHLKAFIEAVLNHDRDDGKTILAPEGWYNSLNVPDDGDADEYTANQLNPAHADFGDLSDEMKALPLSRVQFLDGGNVTLRFRPYLEVFHLSKLLVPGVQIQIDMYFNDQNIWAIRWAGARTLRLLQEDVKVRLFLAQVRVAPSVHRDISNYLKSGKIATYPTVRGEIRTYSHPNDNKHFECNNPFHNQIPNRLVVALMEQAAFNGDITKNPFTFKTFNVSSIKQLIRGEEYPYETLELQHDGTSKDQRGHFRFLQATGCLCRRKGNMVLKDNWGHDKKCTLFVFDNTANGCLDSPVLNPKQSGEVRLVIDFGANPGENLTILLYGEFESLLEINGNRVVTYDVYQ